MRIKQYLTNVARITMRIKQYLTNVARALLGVDYRQAELDEVREMYNKSSAYVKTLEDAYSKIVAKMDATDRLFASLQMLIENLRSRLNEKDDLMARMKEDYQSRINVYSAKIDALTKKLEGINE